MRRPVFAAALTLFATAVSGAAQTSAPAIPTLEIETSPFLDMHYAVRALAAREPAEGALGAAAAALRKVEEQIGAATNWALVEANLLDCESVADVCGLAERAPERSRTRGGSEIPLRAALTAMAHAYEKLEPDFQRHLWPNHREALEGAQARLKLRDPQIWRRCVEDVYQSLNLSAAEGPIRVCLVTEAPFPGGFTYRTRGGGTRCVVAISDRAGPLLEEVILHEAIHVFDVLDPSDGNLLNRLRTRIRSGGDEQSPDPGDAVVEKALRDIPHTVIFAQAAATIRKVIDPDHEDYGAKCGYYGRVRGGDRVRRTWQEFLRGSGSVEQVLSRLADASGE